MVGLAEGYEHPSERCPKTHRKPLPNDDAKARPGSPVTPSLTPNRPRLQRAEIYYALQAKISGIQLGMQTKRECAPSAPPLRRGGAA